jgi:hypothetical protein
MAKQAVVYAYNNDAGLQVSRLRKAGAIPSNLSDEQAEIIVRAGQHFGITAITALSGIRISEGKYIMEFELFRSLVQRSGLLSFEERFETHNQCFVKLMHINGRVEQATFSVQDASKQSLLGKKSWKKDRAEMLYQRAYMKVVRRLFPEISLGIIIQDEYEKPKTFFQKLLHFFLSLRKTKKVEARIIKVSFSEPCQARPVTSENTGVARILAKKAVQVSKENKVAAS